MAKVYEATGIAPGNHDWDYTVDETGQITALNVKGSVEYDGGEMVRAESLDIWPGMAPTLKGKVQQAYTAAVNAFNNYFMG